MLDATDSVSLIPVNLGPAFCAVRKLDTRIPLKLPPASAAVGFLEPAEVSDGSPSRDELDVGELSEDLDQRPCLPPGSISPL